MFELFAITVCIFLNAILAASETAFIATNKSTLKVMAGRGDSKSQLLLKLRGTPEKFLSTIQVGITFLGAFAAAIGGAGAQERISPLLVDRLSLSPHIAELLSTLLVVIPITYFSVVIGELVPKTLALRQPMQVATKTAPWLYSFSQLIFPIVKILEWSTKALIAYFPLIGKDQKVDEEEHLVIEDKLSPLNQQYILNLVKIDRTKVEDIFHQWKYVDHITEESPIEEVEKMLITSGHTRLPVVRKNDVVGVLNSKEFFAYQKTGKNNWLSLIRPPVKVQVNTFILNALKSLQSGTAHMAIVYHGKKVAGIVTMEDIFEEVVGDIYDEDDNGSIAKILSRASY